MSNDRKDDNKYWTIMYQYKNAAPRVIRINNLSTFASKAILFFGILFLATIIGKVVSTGGEAERKETVLQPQLPQSLLQQPDQQRSVQTSDSKSDSTRMSATSTKPIALSPPNQYHDFIKPIKALDDRILTLSHLKLLRQENIFRIQFRLEKSAKNKSDGKITGNIIPILASDTNGFSATSFDNTIQNAEMLATLAELDFYSFSNFVTKDYTFDSGKTNLDTAKQLVFVFKIDGKMYRKSFDLTTIKIDETYSQKGVQHENL